MWSLTFVEEGSAEGFPPLAVDVVAGEESGVVWVRGGAHALPRLFKNALFDGREHGQDQSVSLGMDWNRSKSDSARVLSIR